MSEEKPIGAVASYKEMSGKWGTKHVKCPSYYVSTATGLRKACFKGTSLSWHSVLEGDHNDKERGVDGYIFDNYWFALGYYRKLFANYDKQKIDQEVSG